MSNEVTNPGLAFEQPVFDLEREIDELQRAAAKGEDTHEQLRQLRLKHKRTLQEIYENLTPWQTVQVARHKDRPYTRDYLSMVFEEFAERSFRTKIAVHPAVLADNKPSKVRPAAFEVVLVDAVVADLWVGHRDDLAAVAGVGEDLLIAGHRGVEADLAIDLAIDADRNPGVNGSVFKGKFSGWLHGEGWGERCRVGRRGL